MKITKLTSENVKRVKAVTIEPEGNLVVVGGKNDSGKTSTIGSIAMAIGGKRLCPDVPIRKGEKNAKAEVTLDNGLTITRTFTPSGSVLKVEAADGRGYTSPQTVMDRLVGELGFDPLAFTRMRPKEQGEMLCALVGIDTAAIDAERKQLYTERTHCNRDQKKAELTLETIARDESAPEEEISMAGLIAELKQRQAVNSTVQSNRRLLHSTREEYSRILMEVTQLEEKALGLRDTLNRLAQEGSILSAEVKTATTIADVETIERQMAEAEGINEQIRENKRWDIISDEERVLNAESERLTAEIDKVDQRRAEMISGADYPVPGMAVDGDLRVMLNGLPLSQASSAQQLRCSVAMGLALNPELRVMIVYDGSLLDEDSLAILAEMAEAADAQVWVERVSEGAECTVIIEDGQVKG